MQLPQLLWVLYTIPSLSILLGPFSRQLPTYCCSNFNYKPQTESRQQHLVLYMHRHLHSVDIMIEVTSRHTKFTHFILEFSQMPAVARQWVTPTKKLHLLYIYICSCTAVSSVKQHKPSSSCRALTSRPPSN